MTTNACFWGMMATYLPTYPEGSITYLPFFNSLLPILQEMATHLSIYEEMATHLPI